MKNFFDDIFQCLHFASKTKLTVLFCLMVLAGGLELLTAFTVSQFIKFSFDNVEEMLSMNIILELFKQLNSGYVVTFVTLLIISNIILGIAAVKAILHFAAQLGIKASNHVLQVLASETQRSEMTDSERIKLVTTEAQLVTDGIIIPILQLGNKIILSIILFIALLSYNPFLTTQLASLIFAFYMVITILNKQKLHRNSIEISDTLCQRYSIATDLLRFKNVLKLQAPLRIKMMSKLELAGEHFARSKASNMTLGQTPRFILEGLVMIMLVLGAFWILINAEQGSLDAGTLSFFALATMKLLPAVQQCYLRLSQIMGHKESLHVIAPYMRKQINDKISVVHSTKSNFPKIIYSHQKQDGNIFNQSFEPGYIHVIRAPSGYGKTTMLETIYGNLTPKGSSVRYIGCSSIHEQSPLSISYLPQKTELVDGTLLENLTLYELTDNSEKLDELLDSLNLKRLVQERGLHTEVNADGNDLSGGQIQRIGLVRTLLCDAKVVLLDEPTSALDQQNALKVWNLLAYHAIMKIIICVSHDEIPSAIRTKVLVHEIA